MSKIKMIFASIIVLLLSCASVFATSRAQSHLLTPDSSVPSQTTQLISVSSAGTQANRASYSSLISDDGRYIVFSSTASNLAPGDTDHISDVFLHDTQTGETTLVSISSEGEKANADSFAGEITADGRFIFFNSIASNLVPGDTNNEWDGFRYDTQSGETIRVTLANDGAEGNFGSSITDISPDGRYLVITSYATNLVSEDTNDFGLYDCFRHDLQTGSTILISKSSSGVQADKSCYRPSITDDGRFIVFDTSSDKLTPGDVNTRHDVFIHDIQTGQTSLVSASSQGIPSQWGDSSDPEITPDGRFIVYRSSSEVLVPGDENNYCPIYIGAEYKNCSDIFVYNVQDQTTQLVSVSDGGSQGNNTSTNPRISNNGRYVIFLSTADNLVSGDTNGKEDLFFRDLQLGKTRRISISSSGLQGNGDSSDPDLSADGRSAVFSSESTNLVSDDNDVCDRYPYDDIYAENCPDIFLRKMMQFTDAPPTHWATAWIEGIFTAGITSGYPDGTYRPENPVTRAEMAVFLLNSLGISPATPSGPEDPFSDISGHWAESFILELENQGITGGYPDGTYRPEALVTRAEMAVFLLNAMSVSPPATDGSHPFSDIAGHWAEAQIEELYDQGITGGYPDGTYRPESQVTRAEMAVFLVNAFGILLP